MEDIGEGSQSLALSNLFLLIQNTHSPSSSWSPWKTIAPDQSKSFQQFPLFHPLHTYWHIKTSWGKYVSYKCHGWKSKHEAADYYRVKLKCLSFPPHPTHKKKNKFGRKFRCISLSLLEKAIRVISFHIKVKLQDSAVILTRTWPCS